jgi:hypothetical protein
LRSEQGFCFGTEFDLNCHHGTASLIIRRGTVEPNLPPGLGYHSGRIAVL